MIKPYDPSEDPNVILPEKWAKGKAKIKILRSPKTGYVPPTLEFGRHMLVPFPGGMRLYIGDEENKPQLIQGEGISEERAIELIQTTPINCGTLD